MTSFTDLGFFYFCIGHRRLQIDYIFARVRLFAFTVSKISCEPEDIF